MANNITGVGTANTDADVFVPELWSSGVQNYIKKKFLLANLVNDVSFMVSNAGDTINIPRVTENTATTTTISSFTEGTAAIGYTSPNDTSGTLTVNQMAYYGRIYPDIVEIQANPDLLALHAEAMGFAIGKAIDSHISSLLTTYSSDYTEHSLAADNALTAAELQLIVKSLYTAGIDPADGYVMVVGAELISDLMGLDQFTNADYVKDQFIWKNGLLGSIMGMPVYATNSIAASDGTANHVVGCIYKPNNIFLAYSQKPKMVSQYSVDFLGHKVAAHAYYGSVVAVPKGLVQITNP
tara:strand:- start:1085 stop:1972 length:888 start_codon:yes stop_codon:yes gene_type:complete